MRNPCLTRAMERVLRIMAEAGDDGDLVTEGRRAWVCHESTSLGTVAKLLRMCLIKADGENRPWDKGASSFARYVLNEEGEAALRDPKYVPLILRPRPEENKP